MTNVLEENISLSADSGEEFSEERAKKEKQRLQHRERARTYYWRHRDRLREAVNNKNRAEREDAELPRGEGKGPFVFMTVSLIAVGAAFIVLYLYKRNQRLQRDASMAAEQASFEELSTQTFDIGDGRIMRLRDGIISSF